MVVAIVAGILVGLPKKVATITVNELYKGSTVIATAKVESVDTVEGVKVATAKVLKLHKGKGTIKSVNYLAERTWDCDVSEAMKGETVLIYLCPLSEGVTEPRFDTPLKNAAAKVAAKGMTLHRISHCGFGRIDITEAKKSYVASVFLDERNCWALSACLVLPDDKTVRKSLKDRGNIFINDLLSYR